MRTQFLLLSAVLLTFHALARSRAEAPADLDSYNVVWDSPSQNASGAMPIGNGEVGLNLWVEPDGDLLFYISRTDAWSEACRLLKLGRIRLSLAPNPFAQGAPFRQELKLREGCIVITAGPVGATTSLRIFVDAKHPVIHLIGESDRPVTATLTLENWRSEKKVLQGAELGSSWTMQEAPADIVVWESADVVTNTPAQSITWFHRNDHSCVPVTLHHQGLEQFASLVNDPLLARTFGGHIAARGFKALDTHTLKSDAPVRRFNVQIATHAAQCPSADSWQKQVRAIAADLPDAARAARTTADWWQDFWNRSWVIVDGDDPSTARVTSGYVLQRWLAASAGRGNYPVKFNGSLFTVDPQFTGSEKFNADWRRWGDCYWWQNTRFPAYAAIASGDFDQCRAIFRMYRDVIPICRARAKAYYGAEGVYYPETMTIFGTYANRDYGWNRQGHKASEVLCPYWAYAWQQGLELVRLMQDYYDGTGDNAFLRDELIPMAREVLRYYDTRFSRDRDGKLLIAPSQAVETYWYGVTNDLPSVAGLHAVVGRLLALKGAPHPDRELWTRLEAATPPVPVRVEAGSSYVLPAEAYKPERSNVENPELYAIWPFRLYGVGKPALQTGIGTFLHRTEKSMNGWSYDGQCAAILGLSKEAKRQILAKAANSNPQHRFPAMWGPNYDWLPDQDHGSNLLLTLQNMLLFADGDRINLLPAWPKEWNVKFKLHAPRSTVVEGTVKEGKLVSWKVTPANRSKDVVIPQTFSP